MSPSFNSNDELVDYLVSQGRITSPKVEDAFRKVDRQEFIPKESSDSAYTDTPVPLNGVTVSAPHIVAMVTELLELKQKDKVLEIGSGSGYQAAILGKLAKKVIGIEIRKSLADESRNKIRDNVEIRTGNGFEAVEEKFDKILFSCATENFNDAKNYLKDNGIIVGPVQENGRQVLKKWAQGKTSTHGTVRYVEMED